ncbi:MAG TPA: 16S rRNA (cytosine(1402)-N(4))-methyltransferase RsmH [Candidatus Saccharimonadales bacterium]|nr:16S rRNA (cytosine(1402)-N(4))-methyltransferase RsmH [Candidatus Saccharimonadales bacterium]
MSDFHQSVLVNVVLDSLRVRAGKNYIDATLGGAGHSLEIIRRGGRVLGIDQDADAIAYAKSRIQNSEFRIGEDTILVRGNFKDIDKIAKENGFEKVDGILFDLGVSSYQLDKSQRGFSYRSLGPLDMRMDTSLSVSAADLVNGLREKELTQLFWKLGEETRAKVIARLIVGRRKESQIATTLELAKIIENVYGIKGLASPKARAGANTKVFQALRIAVNDELNSLKTALPKALELLENGGRLVVISFHSLEDRIVKQMFVKFEKEGAGTIITKKPVMADEEELKINRRARSAKLRVFEKNI